MSENKATKKQLPSYVILAIIALVAALALAVTNAITEGPIKEHEEAAQNAAFQSVMEADVFSTMDIPEGYEVSKLVEAKKDGQTIGYCAVSSAKGYGGDVAVTLGVDVDGKVTGAQIGDTNFSETAGFGARWQEAERAEQFKGVSAYGGDTIEAISGATITSKAVLTASNNVLKCISHVLGKDVEGDPLSFGAKQETAAAEPVVLTGDVHHGTASGFAGGEVVARLTLNDDGTISALTIDASTQTEGLGTRCAGEEFTAQFIGRSGPFTLGDGIDAVASATITSTAAVEAINAALEAPAMTEDELAAAEPETTEAPVEPEATEEVPADAKTVTVKGFGDGDVIVYVTDEDGVIKTLRVDASTQTAGFGQKCAGEEFTAQFIGKSAPFTLGDGIDAVASATITSQAVVDAVNSLYAEEETAEDGATAEESTVTVKGFGDGDVIVYVTDEDGVIKTLRVDASTQTAGFGQKCAGEEFTAQFIGKSAPFTLGDGIDAVTSATITSQAVVDAVNSLYAAEATTEAEATEVVAAEPEATEAPADEKTVTVKGFGDGDVIVYVTDEDGVIKTLRVDASTQTAGFGQKCAEEEFTAQFIGKSAPFTLGDGIDAVASATITSQAVVDAVNSLYAEEETAEDGATAEESTVTVKGFGDGDVIVYVTDEDGVIKTLRVDASTQTAGFGQKCAGEEFTAQFIGKSAPFTLGDGIDAVASATITSQAVVDAVNAMSVVDTLNGIGTGL